eukprot:9359548-Lingulodinium_polyedra.AAC.1
MLGKHAGGYVSVPCVPQCFLALASVLRARQEHSGDMALDTGDDQVTPAVCSLAARVFADATPGRTPPPPEAVAFREA